MAYSCFILPALLFRLGLVEGGFSFLVRDGVGLSLFQRGLVQDLAAAISWVCHDVFLFSCVELLGWIFLVFSCCSLLNSKLLIYILFYDFHVI